MGFLWFPHGAPPAAPAAPGPGAAAPLAELQQALELSGGDADRAEAVVKLKGELGAMAGSKGMEGSRTGVFHMMNYFLKIMKHESMYRIVSIFFKYFRDFSILQMIVVYSSVSSWVTMREYDM